jgi:hypothetical protein
MFGFIDQRLLRDRERELRDTAERRRTIVESLHRSVARLARRPSRPLEAKGRRRPAA